MQDEIRFVMGDAQGYAELAAARRKDTPTYDFELIGSRYQYVLLGALSTRSHLKRQKLCVRGAAGTVCRAAHRDRVGAGLRGKARASARGLAKYADQLGARPPFTAPRWTRCTWRWRRASQPRDRLRRA